MSFSRSARIRKTCAFKDCKNSDRDSYTFFGFSAITKRRRNQLKWLETCGLPYTTSPHALLCDVRLIFNSYSSKKGHYSTEEMETCSDYGGVKLKSKAVPTKLLPNPQKQLISNIPLYAVEEDASGQLNLIPVFENTRRKRHFCHEELKEISSGIAVQFKNR